VRSASGPACQGRRSIGLWLETSSAATQWADISASRDRSSMRSASCGFVRITTPSRAPATPYLPPTPAADTGLDRSPRVPSGWCRVLLGCGDVSEWETGRLSSRSAWGGGMAQRRAPSAVQAVARRKRGAAPSASPEKPRPRLRIRAWPRQNRLAVAAVLKRRIGRTRPLRN
jgi:hypothetical protein